MTTPPDAAPSSDHHHPEDAATLLARLAALETSLRAQTSGSAQQLELMLEQAPCVMWTMAADFTVTAAWGAGLALMGRTPKYLAGLPLSQFFDADGPEHQVVAGHQRALLGERVAFEMNYRGHDFDTRLEPLRDAAGNVTGVLGIALDVTQRKLAEAAWHESEDRFRRLASRLPDMIYRLRLFPDTVFDYVSPAAEMLTGYTVEELYGTPGVAMRLFHPADLQRLIAGQRYALSRPAHGPMTVRWVRKDGRQIWVEIHSMRLGDAAGQLVAIESVARDVTARKQAEQELALLAAIIHSSSDAVYGTDLDGTILTWNPAAERLYDYPAAEIVGQDLQRLFPLEVRADLPRLLGQMRRGEVVQQFETVRMRRDGGLVDVTLSIFPVHDADGTVVATAAIARDITERKRAEREMARFAAIVQASNDAIYGTDLYGRVVNWNPAAERLYGYTASEILGQPLTVIYPDDQRHLFGINLARLLSGEHFDQFEAERIRKDGRRVEVLLSLFAVRDPAGEVVAVATIARDITGRKRTERALARHAAIVAASDDAIISTDMNAIITSWNPAAERVYGYAAAEMLGQPITRILASDAPPVPQGILGHFGQGGAPFSIEAIRVRKDGTQITVSLNAFALRDAAGTVTGVGSITRDITEQKRLDAERTRLAAIVAASDDAIISVGLKGLITSWNAGAERVYGYTAGEMIGQPITVLLAPDDRPDLTELGKQLNRGNREVQMEGRRIRKDGTLIQVSVSVFPLRDAAGRMTGAGSIARDITAAKRLEEERVRLAAIVAASHDAILSTSRDGIILSWNTGAERTYGYTSREAVGQSIAMLFAPDDRRNTTQLADRLEASSGDLHFEATRLRRDGERIEMSINAFGLYDQQGQLVAVGAVGRDVTQQKRTEMALRESERFNRAAFDGLPSHIAIVDQDGVILAVNRAWRAFAAASTSAAGASLLCEGANYLAVGRNSTGPSAVQARATAAAIRAVLAGAPETDVVEYACHAPDQPFWFTTRVTRFPGDGPARAVVSHENITRRKLAEYELQSLESRYQHLVENIPGLIYVRDPVDPGKVLYVSPQAVALLGYTPADLMSDRAFWDVHIHPDDQEYVAHERGHFHASGHDFTCEYRMLTHGGEVRWFRDEARFVRDPEGRALYIQGIMLDVTDRKRMEAQLEHQALYDALTALPNRSLLLDRLEHALRHSARQRAHLAFLMLDLDRFKDVNDTFGHSAGDDLLRQVADRLHRALRESDTVARLGGDEFAVVTMAVSDIEAATLVAQRLSLALEAPFTIQDTALAIRASIGIALYPDHGADAETLMRHADVAMYAAKRARGGYAVYTQEHDPNSPDRLALLSDLHRAIESDGLLLYYQPQIELATGRVDWVEALVRWPHPRRGLLLPDAFVPLAEQTGLVHPMTLRLLAAAMRQLSIWQQEQVATGISVNLSVWDLQDILLPERVAEMLEQWSVPASLLKLEITESALMADPEQALDILTRLQAMGVRISVDDYGTGYSSLAYLKKLPLDELKIDQSFVRDMTRNDNDAIIVRSTIDMAHNLGLRTVAEGVETAAMLEQLRAWGCDVAQGFITGQPLPAEQLASWLRQRAAQPEE